jgi:hypothetical protein
MILRSLLGVVAVTSGCAVGLAACSESGADGTSIRIVRESDAGDDAAPGAGGAVGGGGTSNVGGALGSTGGVTGAGGAPSGACDDCSETDLRWGPDGGYAAYVDVSRLTSCRTYTRERSSMPPLTCTVTLPMCPDRTVDAISRALGDAAVQAALHDHKLYGNDPRPVDGQVFRIATANDFIDVGPSCESGCTGMPAALATLVGLLRQLDERELAAEPCHGVFGG